MLTNISQLGIVTHVGSGIYITDNNILPNLKRTGWHYQRPGIDYPEQQSAPQPAGFGKLQTVAQTLTIAENDILNSLSQLSNLHTVGNLFISTNNILPDLDGLEHLAMQTGNLSINGNPALTNIHALGLLTALGPTDIIDNDLSPTCKACTMLQRSTAF